MILSKDTHPERDIYFLGAFVLNSINEEQNENSLLEVYHRANIQNKISMNAFILALDWLFILGAVQYKNGIIENVSKIINN